MSFPSTPEFPDDPLNPYAAPDVEIERRPPAPAALGAIPFTVGDVFRSSWEIYKGREGLCIGAVLFVGVLNFAFNNVLQNVLPRVLASSGVAPALIMTALAAATLAGMVLQLWLTIGQSIIMLKVAKGQHATFADIFSGGRYLPTVIVATLAFLAVALAVALLGAIPAAIAVAASWGNPQIFPVVLTLGLLLPFLGLIWLSLRLYQYMYFIIDRGVAAVDSLRLSAEVTKGRLLKVVEIMSAASLVNLLGALLCLVGLIVTIPYTALLFAVTYLALTGQPVAGRKPAGEFLPELDPI